MSTEGNRRRFLTSAAGVLGVVATQTAVRNGTAAPTPKTANKSISVSLDEIYATSGQKGLRRFPQKWEEKGTDDWWGEVCKSFGNNGSSNAILVHGEGIDEAIRSANGVLCRGAGADTAYSKKQIPKNETCPLWLVAFLGNADISPVEWTVEAVAVEGGLIRFTYRPWDDPCAISLLVEMSYSYWVPLPKLAAGVFTVELYDAAEKAVTFSRRVTVER